MKFGKLFDVFRTSVSHLSFRGVAFEITKNCNLRCKHCYCYEKGSKFKDISDEKWIKIFEDMKKWGVVQAGWVGGEPMLRKDLISIGKEHFPINAIITNGTIPLPKWNDVLFGVSLDGTPGVYEKIRGNLIKNQYKKVENNILDGVEKGNKICALMTINKINQHVIEKFVERWYNTGVNGVIFDFYTPQKDVKNDPIWLSFKERDEVIERLIDLRKKYKGFLPWNSIRVLNSMKSEVCKIHTSNCRTRGLKEDISVLKLNYRGKRSYPCIMGEEKIQDAKIDCDRCGCIFAFPQDLSVMWTSLKTIIC